MTKRGKRISVFVLVLAALLGAAALTATHGGLAWFCPHTLEYQTQSEWTVLGGQIVVYRSRRQSAENELVDFLLREGYVTLVRSGECPRWHLMFHWNESWRDGYSYLGRVFTRHRESLIDWSRRYPDAAMILWSEGFRLLRSEDPIDHVAGEYFLHYCWRSETVEELQTEIEKWKKAIRAELSSSPHDRE
jgi:hypothetical protein